MSEILVVLVLGVFVVFCDFFLFDVFGLFWFLLPPPHLLSTRLSLRGRVLVVEESPIQDPIEFNRLRLNSIGVSMQLVFSLHHF